MRPIIDPPWRSLNLFLNGNKKENKKMEDSYKEVYFNEYCKTCAHFDLKENQDPCHECLGEPVNLYSHKPVKWEKKESK